MKLSDAQWQALAPLLPGKSSDPGANAKNNRLFIDAVLWVVKYQSSWSDLPPSYGNWRAAYMRFRRWNAGDFWHQLAQEEWQDPALQEMLERIACYGDAYTRQLEWRHRRKRGRQQPSPSRQAAAGGRKTPQLAEESTGHWVSLVQPR